jgi:hypothetical protein
MGRGMRHGIWRMAAGVAIVAGAGLAAAQTQPPAAASGLTPEQVVAYSISPNKLPTAPIASVPQAFGHPDFSGYWLQDQGILFSDPTPKHHSGSHPGYDDTINPIPFTPAAAAAYKVFNDGVKANGYDRINDCDPTGMPRIMANPFPMELIQLKDKLVMLFEFKSQVRRAYMDGRPHPNEDNYDASYMGHSIAKWEGDTLVVETENIGVFPGKKIQITGIMHGDKLKTVERVRFLTPDRIEWEITMIDPEMFTKPWVNRRSFTRRSLKIDVPEYECPPGELIKELGYVKGPKPAAPAPKK